MQAGRDLQAGGRLAQHGHDEFRALPDDPALQGQVQIRLGGAVSRRIRKKGMFKNTFADIEYILTTCAENNTRFEIECYDIGHLYTLRHFLDRGVVKPPLFVQSVFGILGGIGPHPGRRHHDEAHRRPAARRQLSLVGARRRRQPDAGRRAWRRRWAATCASAWRIRSGSGPASSPSRTPSRSPTCARSSKAWAWRSPSPDEAREILSLKGGDKVNF